METVSAEALAAIAEQYAALAGVLAAFAFAGLVGLISTQMSSPHPVGASLLSLHPLTAAFVSLSITSLCYTTVSGEATALPHGADVPAGITGMLLTAGMAFAISGILLLYSLVILLCGLARDLENAHEHPHHASMCRAAAHSLQRTTACAAPLFVVLLCLRLADHLSHSAGARVYAPAPQFWIALLAVAVPGLALVLWFLLPSPLRIRLWNETAPKSWHAPVNDVTERYGIALVRFLCGLGIALSMASLLGVSVMRTIGWAHTTPRDWALASTIIVVAIYTVAVLISMTRYGVGPLIGERERN